MLKIQKRVGKIFNLIIIMGLFSMSKADYDRKIADLERRLGVEQARLARGQALKASATSANLKNDANSEIACAKVGIARIKSEIAAAKAERKSAK